MITLTNLFILQFFTVILTEMPIALTLYNCVQFPELNSNIKSALREFRPPSRHIRISK